MNLAFQRAKEIAEKYHLDLELAAIAGEEVEKTPFTEEIISEEGRLPVAHKFIVHIVQNYFRVTCIYCTYDRNTKISFVGRKADIGVAREVYHQLLESFDYLWKQYKATNNLGNNMKAAYMIGLQRGVSSKLEHAEKNTFQERLLEIPEDIRAGTSEKLQLAIINEKEELKNAVASIYTKLGKRRLGGVSGRIDHDVINDGFRHGREINLGRRGMIECAN